MDSRSTNLTRFDPMRATSGMAYWRRGNGRPLIMLHGWCLNHCMWMYAEDEFCSDYCIISPDLAGFGQSDHLRGPYSLTRYADDVRSLIEELDLQDVVLVGFAFGAAIAIETASISGDRIAGLVSVGVPGAAHSPYARMPKAMRRDWPDFARRSAQALFHNPQSEATLIWLERLFASAPLSVAIETVAVLAAYEPVDHVGAAKVPQVFIHADKDTVAPVALGEVCSRTAPNGRLSVIADCGHLIVLDRKDAFHASLRAFLQQL